MSLNPEEIRKLASENLEYTIQVRRNIHMNPELSYKEYNTSKYIASELELMGITDLNNVAGTGIIARLKGKSANGSNIVLRSELDALPIIEETGAEYASKTKGLMHACGHDAHSAMLLSVARALYSINDRWDGNVYLLFQPGEELAPGGASIILEEGVLQKIKPDAIVAQHVLPEMKAGNTGFRAGKYMASSDEIYIDIKGIGGHAALPGATDQVLIASNLVRDLKKSVNRLAGDSKIAFALGKFMAEGATNVIPQAVHIEGTLRTFDEDLRAKLHAVIQKTCKKSEGENVKVILEIRKGYPVLYNNPDLTIRAAEVAASINGKETVEELELRMSSEDFAFYSMYYPAVFYRLGVRQEGKTINKLHTSSFNIFEPVMETGIRTMLAITLDLLDRPKNGQN